jgi:hypothetical protein
MLKLRLTLLIAVAASPLALVGCGDEPAGSCERIIEACHEKDTGSGLAHDCHEAAEAEGATDESCSELEDDCLEGCAAE